jgi:hypothetical protein
MIEFMEPLMIMASQMKPPKEEMAFFPELLILQAATDLPLEYVEMIETLRASKLFTIQFVLGPVKITKEVLLPS